jgi:shikimate kinase
MNISLWGFMGAGKSTLAKALADSMELDWLDADQELEQREGRSIQEIFAQEGEAYFRQLETALLRELVESGHARPLILSTGGGMPMKEENRQLLKTFGLSVYLHVSFEDIRQRLAGDCTRPLWSDEQIEAMRQRYEERIPTYQLADVTLVGNKSSHELVQEIEQVIQRTKGHK